MSERSLCPRCKGTDLVPWSLGKVRCRTCQCAFPPQEVEQPEGRPRRPVRSQSTRVQADKQERRVAKRLDARQTIASGQTPVDKGDVRSELLRVECKYTDSKSYSLKAEDLVKIANQSTGDQIPLFFIEFREDGQAYYVVPENWFHRLLEAYKNDLKDQ